MKYFNTIEELEEYLEVSILYIKDEFDKRGAMIDKLDVDRGIQYVLDWYIYDEDEEVIGGMELFLDKELYSRIRNGDIKMDDILNEEYPIQGKYILNYWANEEED